MKLGISVWLGLAASTLSVWAQVSAGLQLAQDQFLPGEAIPVSVRITNFSGQTLELGRDNFWLQFLLEEKAGPSLASISNVPVEGAFDLEHAMIATKRVDLAPHYPLLQPGRYVLSAVVRIPRWAAYVELDPVEFDVFAGTVLWEQVVGLPGTGETPSRPELRRYALQQALHLKQLKLYVRVSDPTSGRVYAVLALGPMLTFSKPERQIDRDSNLHVFWQYGARSFYHCVLNPQGRLIQRRTHDYLGPSRPVLGVGSEGEIMVRGGVRRRAPDDWPADDPLPAPDPQPQVPPAGTLGQPLPPPEDAQQRRK